MVVWSILWLGFKPWKVKIFDKKFSFFSNGAKLKKFISEHAYSLAHTVPCLARTVPKPFPVVYIQYLSLLEFCLAFPVCSRQNSSHGVPADEASCPPWRDHPLGDPVWGPNLISFCFISDPRRSFFHLNLQAVSAHFWPREFFNVTDGWW